MEHVVFFPSHDGAPAFRRVAELADAVRLVEHLRNVEGVSEVSLYSLTEVPVTFRPWYRVEVPGAEGAAVAEAPAGEPAAEESPVVPGLVPDPGSAGEGVPAAVSAGEGEEPDRSLGFFS